MSSRPQSTLRRRLIEEMTLRGYAATSIRTYVWSISHLSRFYRRSPDELSGEEVRAYLLHLLEEKKAARGTLSVALAAARFFYGAVLGREVDALQVARPKRQKRLPVVLTRSEVWKILDEVRSDLYRACLVTAYSCGLRRQEAIQLRVADVDGERGLLHVHGKRGKDRYVQLPKKTLRILRQTWLIHRSPVWLFPAPTRHGLEHSVATGAGHLHPDSLRRAFRQAVRASGVHKTVTVHTLRHSYATHLHEAGVQLQMIQKLLGHAHVETTAIYTHVTREIRRGSERPIEELMRRP